MQDSLSPTRNMCDGESSRHGPACQGESLFNSKAWLKTNCQQGVQNLRVADASVFPVAITAHLQVATYGMAEQAAVIIGGG